jgi:adenylate cyclase
MEIKNLSSLTELNISHNKLKSLPSALENLVSLHKFQANDNLIVSIPAYFGNLISLTTLLLHNNDDLVVLPNQFLYLTNLSNLSIANVEING